MEERFYYKTQDEKVWLNLKTPDFDNDENYIKITEEEFNEHLETLEKGE